MTALTIPTEAAARRPDPGEAGGRDPAHELYEHAAGVLASAQALEAATHADGAVAAVSPTLTCLETALAALAEATERRRAPARERLTDPGLLNEGLRVQRTDLAAQLDRLAGILGQASETSASARAAVEPLLSELTVP
jgi:small-conductance mechanosensitive channel